MSCARETPASATTAAERKQQGAHIRRPSFHTRAAAACARMKHAIAAKPTRALQRRATAGVCLAPVVRPPIWCNLETCRRLLQQQHKRFLARHSYSVCPLACWRCLGLNFSLVVEELLPTRPLLSLPPTHAPLNPLPPRLSTFRKVLPWYGVTLYCRNMA